MCDPSIIPSQPNESTRFRFAEIEFVVKLSDKLVLVIPRGEAVRNVQNSQVRTKFLTLSDRLIIPQSY